MEAQHQERNTEKETEVKQSVSTATAKCAVPSATSSPSHEFSFAVSLLNSETARAPAATPEKTRPALAIDLTPADEIFFHGHLLPLHFLSHLHASSSPRSSTNSLDSFTLPIKEEQKPNSNDMVCSCEDDDDDCISYDNKDYDLFHEGNIGSCGVKERSTKSKPFSLFGLGKWRKGSDAKERSENRENEQEHRKKKLKFDVSQFLKRYLRMVKPLLSPKSGRRDKIRVRRQSYSFSGILSPREKREVRGRRGEFSAPASMRTSPTNSGLLLATAGVPSPASDSTMEELQAAIQAAIAHCKNSIANDQDKKTQDLSVPVN